MKLNQDMAIKEAKSPDEHTSKARKLLSTTGAALALTTACSLSPASYTKPEAYASGDAMNAAAVKLAARIISDFNKPSSAQETKNAFVKQYERPDTEISIGHQVPTSYKGKFGYYSSEASFFDGTPKSGPYDLKKLTEVTFFESVNKSGDPTAYLPKDVTNLVRISFVRCNLTNNWNIDYEEQDGSGNTIDGSSSLGGNPCVSTVPLKDTLLSHIVTVAEETMAAAESDTPITHTVDV